MLVRDAQELAIRIALMMPLNNINQMAAPPIQQNVSRARILCEQLDQSQLLPRVVAIQFWVHWSVRNFAIARDCTEQLQALAVHSSDEITHFIATFIAGILSSMNGDYVSARDHFERSLKLSDGTCPALMKDPITAPGLVNCTGYLGLLLWMLGYPEKARKQHAHMLGLLGEPIDAFARGVGILDELGMSEFMRDNRRMLEAAEGLIALARESGIPLLSGMGMIWLGRARAVEGAVARGIEAVAEGRDILLGREPAMLDWLEHCAAAAYLAAGRTDDGLAIVEEMIEKCAVGGVRFYEADLHRLKGELLLAAGAPMTDAEECFRKAITIAQRQQAKSWELRATLSLARLLMKQGPRDEAHTMLSEIYGWFTEGFDTTDLTEAKTILDELN